MRSDECDLCQHVGVMCMLFALAAACGSTTSEPPAAVGATGAGGSAMTVVSSSAGATGGGGAGAATGAAGNESGAGGDAGVIAPPHCTTTPSGGSGGGSIAIEYQGTYGPARAVTVSAGTVFAALDWEPTEDPPNPLLLRLQDGCEPEVVGFGRASTPFAIAQDDAAVYVDGYRYPDAGGAVGKYATSEMLAVAVDSLFVYWMQPDLTESDGTTASLWRAPKQGGPAMRLADGQMNPKALAVADGNLYWTLAGPLGISPLGARGAVVRMDPVGTVETIAAQLDAPRGLVVGPDRLYVAVRGEDRIIAIPFAGGAPTDLVSAELSPSALALDGQYLYWTTYGPTGAVKRVPLGGGSVDTIVDAEPDVGGIALDETYVYWTTGSFVARAPKKP